MRNVRKTSHTKIALLRVFTHITQADTVVTYVKTLFECLIKIKKR